MKKLIFVAVIVAIAVFAFYKTKPKESELVFYGNIDTDTTMLSFRFLGEIDLLLKEEGESVKKGEAVAKLNDEYLQNELKRLNSEIKINEIKLEKLIGGYRDEEILKAKANVKVAQANLVDAKQSFDRQAKLLPSKSTSKELYDRTKAAFESAKSNLEYANANYEMVKNGYEDADIKAQKELINSLKISLEKINLDIKNSTLTSPLDGIVLKKLKEVGEIASPNERIYEIAKSGDFWVRAYADESYLGKISAGTKMLIYTDLKDEPYEGEVSFIASVAEFTPKNVETIELRSSLVYRFKVDIKNGDDRLKQGIPVHLKIK